ncbi:MAG: glycosyltransferase family 2 protein [Patescibacteria group bacterium]|jgi:GT2 family glycosyltransferase
MDLSVIIVSWNVKDKLRANLQALLASSTKKQIEIFVVDNNSQDGSAVMVATEFPSVKLIANTDNHGFAKANNQALKLASGRYLLLLNPDMLVRPDTLEKMLAWAEENQQATVSGYKLTNPDGQVIPQIRRFPRFCDQLFIVLKLPHLLPALLNRYLEKNFNYEQAAAVDSVRGACFLINRQSWTKISGADKPYLDERYFIWFEEVDFCRQVKIKGGEVWYSPAATLIDYVGASFNQVDRPKKQAYFAESMLKYFLKWQPRWQARFLRAAWFLVGVKLPALNKLSD